MGIFDFIEQDKRIIEQKVRSHEMTQNEYQKFLKALPDEKESGEEILVTEEDISPTQGVFAGSHLRLSQT